MIQELLMAIVAQVTTSPLHAGGLLLAIGVGIVAARAGTSGMVADIALLGASSVNDNGVPLVQGEAPGDDAPELNDMFQALGFASAPWPADAGGAAEGVRLRIGNRNAAIVGARDVRTSRIVGKMKPGDTVVHSTGPNLSSQLHLKEEKRMAALLAQTPDGKTIGIIVDGNQGTVTLAGVNSKVELSPAGLQLGHESAGALFQGDRMFLLCNLSLPGMPSGTALMAGPLAGTGGGTTSSSPVILIPVKLVGK